MYGTLDISTSGMIAQRIRLEVISANIANRDALLNPAGEFDPYRRREVMFAPGNPSATSPAARSMGVHVADIHINHDALRPKWEPGSPFDTDGDGYIMVPDIDPVTEQVNAMEALRAYEANVAAAQATKTMMAQALRLLA
ncbi:MAG: flagellar basal body rod protein FlgC [Phycisphaeraceae bacterium]|nr:flagellar basal body rod protein FlgC [Phycisphaeraceae bacterium]MCW5754068.1 flagellar basal body rod protein FlgC [Phycisphaeraceae bacterium]